VVRLKSLHLSALGNVGFGTHRAHAAGHKRLVANGGYNVSSLLDHAAGAL
jgi:hypothetical protein